MFSDRSSPVEMLMSWVWGYDASNFFLTSCGILANFERLVLGGIATNLCKQILVGKLLTRSTRFTNFCTAPHSKIQLNFVKHFRNFMVSFSKFHSSCAFLCISHQFWRKFSGISANMLDYAGNNQNLLDSQVSWDFAPKIVEIFR